MQKRSSSHQVPSKILSLTPTVAPVEAPTSKQTNAMQHANSTSTISTKSSPSSRLIGANRGPGIKWARSSRRAAIAIVTLAICVASLSAQSMLVFGQSAKSSPGQRTPSANQLLASSTSSTTTPSSQTNAFAASPGTKVRQQQRRLQQDSVATTASPTDQSAPFAASPDASGQRQQQTTSTKARRRQQRPSSALQQQQQRDLAAPEYEQQLQSSPPASSPSFKMAMSYSLADDSQRQQQQSDGQQDQTTSGSDSQDPLADSEPHVYGSVAGAPGVDFPAYTRIPKTSFSCDNKGFDFGFYADEEAQCQVYHVCWSGRRESFLCGIGTVFNQAILACDYWHSVDCSKSSQFYGVNSELGECHGHLLHLTPKSTKYSRLCLLHVELD